MSSLYLSLLFLENKIVRLNSRLDQFSDKYYNAINSRDLNHFYDKFNYKISFAKKIKIEFNRMSTLDENFRLNIENSIRSLENEIDTIGKELQIYFTNKV